MTPLTLYPMLMDPYFSTRPWGGRRLADVLAKKVDPQGGPYGEAWELSDHPDGRSRVANGPVAGQLFGDVIRAWPDLLLGVAKAPDRYPLLVKYIDAAQDLSVQVHPSDATAPAGDRGKTECWYVMDCDPGAQMIHGLAPGVDAAALERAARSGEIEPCIRRFEIHPGDFIDIPAGTVHATLRGTLLCEVQQSSNTTYRLWDWNRQPPRPLHVAEAVRVANYDPAATPDPVNVRQIEVGRWLRLVRNEFFETQIACWPAGEAVVLERPNPHGLILNVVEGGGSLSHPSVGEQALDLGQTWFLPARMARWGLRAGERGLRVLVSESLEIG